ncbi:MAG: Holliday junction branch migration protein RuvA [Aureliella sp.]
MITKISGQLISLEEESATLSVPPMEYEVLIPEYTRRHLQTQIGKQVSLNTIYYMEGNAASGGKLMPRLVGFLSTVEREFFELFCSVDGVGVKKALRAMTQPVQDTAVIIEQQDTKALSALPGVGPATAERIVAKLRRKMPKFALLVRRDLPTASDDTSQSVVEETYHALLALGHNDADARKLIDQALATGTKFKDTETLIQLIYKKQFGS